MREIVYSNPAQVAEGVLMTKSNIERLAEAIEATNSLLKRIADGLEAMPVNKNERADSDPLDEPIDWSDVKPWFVSRLVHAMRDTTGISKPVKTYRDVLDVGRTQISWQRNIGEKFLMKLDAMFESRGIKSWRGS